MENRISSAIHNALRQRADELIESHGLWWEDAMMQAIAEMEIRRDAELAAMDEKMLKNAAFNLLIALQWAIDDCDRRELDPPWLKTAKEAVSKSQREKNSKPYI